MLTRDTEESKGEREWDGRRVKYVSDFSFSPGLLMSVGGLTTVDKPKGIDEQEDASWQGEEVKEEGGPNESGPGGGYTEGAWAR